MSYEVKAPWPWDGLYPAQIMARRLEVAQRMAEALKSCPYGAADIRTWMDWNDSRKAILAEWEQR